MRTISMFLTKLCLLGVSCHLQLKASVPPNIPNQADKVKVAKTFFERNTWFIVYVCILPALLVPLSTQVLTFLAKDLSSISSELDRTVFHTVCPRGTSANFQHLTTTFLVAYACMLTGSLIRLLCYRTLGRFFTYQVTIRSGHKIIDHGPYSIVRHPSYMGLYLIYIGASMILFDPQGFPNACGWTAWAPYQPLRILWLAFVVYYMGSIAIRTPEEEVNLAIHFGREWQDYTQKVRYRIIPGIY